jgi:hypothetical protein
VTCGVRRFKYEVKINNPIIGPSSDPLIKDGMAYRCQQVPLPWTTGFCQSEERTLSGEDSLPFNILTLHFVDPRKGWLCHGFKFRSLGVILLPPYTFPPYLK